MQSLLATHINKVHALEGVFKEYEAIKHEVPVLCELVECLNASSSSSHSIHKVEVEGKSDNDNSSMSEGDKGELPKEVSLRQLGQWQEPFIVKVSNHVT